jgi:hypothetical protein
MAVSAVTWYELAWMAHHERIEVSIPVRTWLHDLARDVRTVAITLRSQIPPFHFPQLLPATQRIESSTQPPSNTDGTWSPRIAPYADTATHPTSRFGDERLSSRLEYSQLVLRLGLIEAPGRASSQGDRSALDATLPVPFVTHAG